MSVFFQYLFLFFVGALLGWCIELVFRRCFSPAKKWINPGFLNGPYLPLYGFGTCILYFVCDLKLDFWWTLLIVCAGMTLIEYIAGIIFIKGMGIKLWDYSKRWGNLQGIICPLFSFLWTVLGAIFLFFVYPYLESALVWLSNNLTFLFVMGMFYGVMVVDIAISFQLSVRIRKIVRETKSVIAYESLKYQIRKDQKEMQKKASFLMPFRSSSPLRDSIKRLLESIKENKM